MGEASTTSARIAVAAVGAVLVAVLAVELAKPREFLTGSNSAGSDGTVVHVDAGRQLCVAGLELPPRTGRVRLRLGPLGATTVATELRVGGRVRRGSVALAPRGGPPGSDPATLDVPVDAARAAAGAQQLCLTPSGPIDVAGRRGLEPGQTAALLDGDATDARVAVWYLPPAGERRSLLAQLPDMFERAALFRPGIVGPWTYWVVLLLLTPALALAALALLWRAICGRRLWRPALVIGVLGFLAAASWSLVVPVFDAPDEVEHVAYAQAIAETGRAPDAGPSPRRSYSSEAQVAYEGARLSGFYGQRQGRPPWTADDERRWSEREASERPPAGDGGGWLTTADYTPVYYASLAPAYLAAGSGSIWSRVTVMRLVSALFGGLTAAFVFLLVAELVPRPRWPAVAAGLLVAFQPMFAFIAGVVNNDAAVCAAAAGALYLVVRALRRRLTVRLALAIGVTVALLPLLKGSGLFLLPAIAVGVGGALLRLRRAREAVARPLAALGAGVLATALVAVALSSALDHSADPTRPGWYAAEGNTYPTRPGRAVEPSKAFTEPLRFAQYEWQLLLPPVAGMDDLRPGGGRFPGFHAYVERGWAAFGFLSIQFPKWVYGVIALTLAALAVLTGLALARHREAALARRWELSVLALVVLGVFFGTEVAYYAPGDPSVPVFGRYLFPAAGAIAALAVFATFGLGRRRAAAIAAGLVTAMLVLFWASQWLTLSALYT